MILGRIQCKPCKFSSIRDGGESLPHEDGQHADANDPPGDPDDHAEVVWLVVDRAHRLLVLLLQVQQDLVAIICIEPFTVRQIYLFRAILAPCIKLIRKAATQTVTSGPLGRPETCIGSRRRSCACN